MRFFNGLLTVVLLCTFFGMESAYSQCNALRPQIDISFNTDQDCAPVTVTQFTITYYFNTPQDPNDIQIVYEWNDPTNAITIVDNGSGLIAGTTTSGPNTSFSANATFTYFDNNGQCAILPTASIIIGGVLCTSSSQTQTAFFWGTDEQANGVVQMDPVSWDVCFNNPVVNAVFTDNSEFNCNIVVEPDNPNRFARHVQFVYGTNHNPAATIRNLSLNDGAAQALTTGTGALSSSSTRGGGALQLTGAYFGPVDVIPFPADAPASFTFPMSAPANALNAIGNRFEITMLNWNICNPWNGDPVNPNYEDAILTTGYITIVDAPAPVFETRDSNGNATKDFCIDEDVFFVNLTANTNAYGYTWEFYDDATGVNLVGTSTQTNPTFVFSSGGTKLIRLTASNPTAQGSCVEVITDVVNITPSLVASISMTDLSDTPISGDFCQNTITPATFDVRFRDVSVGTVTGSTRWRWEFYDVNNNLIRQEPNGGGFSTSPLGPFDEVFSNPGVYRVRLIIRDNVTLCETEDEVQVRVFNDPVADFNFTRVCAGNATDFTDNSSLTSINGQQIIQWEWDTNYDGITFNPNATFTNQQNFNFTYPSAGTYDVALRVTTDLGGCSAVVVKTVTVDPLPNATFSPDVLSGCSVLTVNFTNNSVNGQPDVIDRFVWEINSGSGFVVDSIQRPTDPGFSNVYTKNFENFGTVDRVFQVQLRVVTQNNCETVSGVQVITVSPGPRSGFAATNYSPFNQNCSPQTVNFLVDAQTQSLNPSDYRWIVTDASGTLVDQSTGTNPNFSYQFINGTQSIRDYQVTLRTTLATSCNRDSIKTIRINPVPNSVFIRDTILFDCDQMQMRFEAQQKGLSEYFWTIVVNGSIILAQPDADILSYTFNRTAVQQDVEVRLRTTNFANCQSTVSNQFFSVPVASNFTVSFSANPITQTLPNSTVTLVNNTTAGPWQYTWDFGDGNSSSSANPGTHTYATFGTYTITLTVSDGSCSESQSIDVTINPIPPILDFTYNPGFGCAPLTVTFTNTSQFANTSTYLWDFGDGFTSNAINPVHTYTQTGVFTVSLSASDNGGGTTTVTKSQIIQVFSRPIAQFAIKPSVVNLPNGTVYTDNQSFGATSYLWDFGDGSTSMLFEPNHVYTTEGSYDVTLIAANADGCADTLVVPGAVKAEQGAQILIPNAFSPGRDGPGSGDGKNDTFIPKLYNVVEFQMMIFNRWGELLFETRNPEVGWDGYHNGKLCQQDVYVYKIIAKYSNGNTVTKSGDVHLIR